MATTNTKPASEAGASSGADPTNKKLKSLTDSPHTVDAEQAVRERVQLHPHALAHDIVAMMELEGVPVSAELVQRVQQEIRGPA